MVAALGCSNWRITHSVVESRLSQIRYLSTKKSDSGEDKGEVTKKSRLRAWLGLMLRMISKPRSHVVQA